ncbi:hypothetical protein [Streptomyces sp. P9-2]|uniref:hypothetical protein n=1 Tax=Streptomyces sp. P9-2 TaxID=3423201 RepID=UPI003479BD17
MTAAEQSLSLRVVVPSLGSREGSVECRPYVDGRDILADVFDKGPADDPQDLLGPDSPLFAMSTPREVRLAEARCTVGCCGAVYVRIRREGRQVIWSDWRNPDGKAPDLLEFRFDAEQYEAEVRRAVTDHGWEWPARTIARLLDQRLRERLDWLSRWECVLGRISTWHAESDRINLFLFHPGRAEGGPWVQFLLELPVSSDDPTDQARDLEEIVTAVDPREVGEVCGGSREYADMLGYPWPGSGRRGRTRP